MTRERLPSHRRGGPILEGLTGATNTNAHQVFYLDASGRGYFGGNLNVTGNVSKGGGLVKIEPESKGINAPDLPPHIPDSTALENRVAENRKIANGKPR